MVKLGAKQLARQREYAGGKLTQQLGVKPTQAAVQRTKDIEAEKERIRKENERIAEANRIAEEKYLAEKKRIDEANARQQRVVNVINERLKAQAYAEGVPSWMNASERKQYQQAMDAGASASVSASIHGTYPTGKVYYKGETEGTFTSIAPTTIKPELVAVQVKSDRDIAVEDYFVAKEREIKVSKEKTQSQINVERWKEKVFPKDTTKYNLPFLSYNPKERYPVTKSEDIYFLKEFQKSLQTEQIKPVTQKEFADVFFRKKEYEPEIIPAKLPQKVVAEFVPTTTFEVVATAGAIAAFPYFPAVARVGVGAGITILETPKVFDRTLPTEKRIASGIIGGLAGVGTAFEAYPFIKGQVQKLSPSYKSIETQPQGYEAIVGGAEAKQIGLIKPGKGARTVVKLPKTSPLVRGGFGVKPGEKSLFIGGPQEVATSQRGLFKVGKDIPIKREFFITPTEPYLKIPVTRESRLGLGDFWKFYKSKIGFGIPPQPQIGTTTTTIGRTETATQFAIGKGSELEAIKTFGTITGVQKVGVTTVKGQAVDLFKFNIGEGISTPLKVSSTLTTPTTSTVSRTSGEILLAITGVIRPIDSTTSISSRTIPSTSRTYDSEDPLIPKPTIPTTPTRGTGGISYFTPPTIVSKPTPTIPSPPITLPSSPPSTISYPPITPPSSPPTTRKTPIKKPPYFPPRFRIKVKTKQKKTQFKTPKFKVSRQPSLWAVGERIYAPTKGRFETSGLTLRPIILDDKKKKRSSIFKRTMKPIKRRKKK